MSTQEERFAEIAAAIREKDGTTAPIKALDFAARIRAIETGGGGTSTGALRLADFTSAQTCDIQIEVLEGVV